MEGTKHRRHGTTALTAAAIGLAVAGTLVATAWGDGGREVPAYENTRPMILVPIPR